MSTGIHIMGEMKMIESIITVAMLIVNITVLVISIAINRSVAREMKQRKKNNAQSQAEREILEHAKRLGVKIGEE